MPVRLRKVSVGGWTALVLWGVAVVAAAAALSRADAPSAQVGLVQWPVRVVKVAGVARWAPEEEGPWRPLSVGMVLRSGDWVRTGPPGSLVELVYEAQASRLLVESETLLQIGGAYRSLARGVSGEGGPLGEQGLPAFRAAFVRLGSVWAQVASGVARLMRFEIETPTAVAGVRGTLFRLRVTPSGATWLYVREGIVELRSDGAVHVVGPGGAASAGGPEGQEGLRRFIEESQATLEWLGGLTGLEGAGPGQPGLLHGSPTGAGGQPSERISQAAGPAVDLEARVGETAGALLKQGLDDAPAGVVPEPPGTVPEPPGQGGSGDLPAEKAPGGGGG